MSRIIVFGAGGRGGRATIQEAVRRGHRVTAVVRDSGKHADLVSDGVEVVVGDVTDVEAVARLAKGHDAAVNSTADLNADFDAFFSTAARATLEALAAAGVGRLVTVGLASLLENASGVPLMDTPGYPQEYRSFYLGHEAGMRVLRETATPVDWVVLSPAGDFDHGGTPTGRYRLAPGDADSRITYADFALAVLDEIDNPAHHKTHLGIEAA
ncbi:NAD(P)-dependent oxidoreductase [Nonomuraea sediminis]|uniref:NAD(P)-dependent oxidoreductase n=1 Tax=Nonomuraea sediminis TaxID=2835864 RepID=UPI001BDDBEEF|nr:NAD(P)H-binding protein [Nonomuraea sediminis]